MIRAYVSSTSKDLTTQRTCVAAELRRLDVLDIAMEHYVADPRRPVERCIEDVLSCDLFVLLVAWRRGYVPEDDNPEQLSITELEYQAARDAGKHVLVFLLDEDAPWPGSKMDVDRTAVQAFRGRLEAAHSPDRFSTIDVLGSRITQAVVRWKDRQASGPDLEPDLDAYRQALLRRYEVLDLDVFTPPEADSLRITLSSVYVEPTLLLGVQHLPLPAAVRRKLRSAGHHSGGPPSTRPDSAGTRRGPAIDLLAGDRNQHVILGHPGSGKSTLSRRIALGLALSDPAVVELFGARVPFVVELRQFAPSYKDGAVHSPLEYLHRRSSAEGWGLSDEAVDACLSRGALVLFDGLDEVFDPATRTDIAQQVVAFAGRYPTTKVIVTSRVVGYNPKTLSDAGFVHASISDLDRRQINAFLSRWYDQVGATPELAKGLRERLLQAYDERPSIRQLAGSPLLLTLLALINQHRDLPRERVLLYQHAADVLTHQWDVRKEITQLDNDLDETDKKDLLRKLALTMQSGAAGLAGNYIDGPMLQALFVDYIRDRLGLSQLDARRIARRLVEGFQTRNYVLVLYGADLYGFVHRGLLEYFAALALQHQFEKSRELSVEGLRSLVVRRADVPEWREVLLLLLSMLDASVSKGLIEDLIGRPHPESHYDTHDALSLAAAALIDVRDRGTHRSNAKLALQRIGERLDHALERPYWGWLTHPNRTNPLLASVRDIAARWPSPEVALEWLDRNETSEWTGGDPPYFGDPFDSLPATVGMFLNHASGGLADLSENDTERVALYLRLFVGFHEYATHDDPIHRAIGLWGWAFRSIPLENEDPIIANALQHDPSELVRWHAAGALLVLSIIQRTDVLDLLAEAARSDPSGDVRAAALSAHTSGVLHWKRDHLGPQHVAFVEGFLSDDNPQVRLKVINALISLPITEDRLEEVAIGLLESETDPTVRWRVAALFGKQLVGRPGTPRLVRTLAQGDPNERVREEAVSILAASFAADDPNVAAIIGVIRSDPKPTVRAKALQTALQNPTPFEPLPPLLFERARADTAPDIRATALRALFGRRKRDAEDLLELLRHVVVEDANGDNRIEAARELLARDADRDRVLPLLRERLEADRSKRVRKELMTLVDAYGSRDP